VYFWDLKGCFGILKTGTRIHGTESTDKIWLTCCALHNLLLEVDGLDERWQHGVESDWEGELGEHNSGDASSHAPTFALRHLNSPESRRNYDTSGMGHSRDYIEAEQNNAGDDGEFRRGDGPSHPR